MNQTLACSHCKKPKGHLHCGICNASVCKNCAQFLPDEAFTYAPKKSEHLLHACYCPSCFDQVVSPDLMSYEECLMKAREVVYFTKAQSKQTGHIKRKENPIEVIDCEDEQETILKLAYQAALSGYNTIIDLEMSHRKIIHGSHKKTIFSAKAVPVNIDSKKIREN